jgi:hypothetical protein
MNTDLKKPTGMGDEPATPHELLYRAYVANKIHLGMKGALNSRSSPVHNLWENTVPYGLILLVIVNYTFTSGLPGFLVSAMVGAAVGLGIVPRWIMIKVRKRTVAYAFGSAKGWQELWSIGGLSIRLADNPEVMCDSPGGDWQAFAGEHLASS